jgi:hypothetical protein
MDGDSLRTTGGGDYVTVNEDLISARYAGADRGAVYECRDEGVEPGVTYEYALEVLKTDGSVIHIRLPAVTMND